MKKNGFVFIETIVVTGFLITSLMVLYTLFVAIVPWRTSYSDTGFEVMYVKIWKIT